MSDIVYEYVLWYETTSISTSVKVALYYGVPVIKMQRGCLDKWSVALSITKLWKYGVHGWMTTRLLY